MITQSDPMIGTEFGADTRGRNISPSFETGANRTHAVAADSGSEISRDMSATVSLGTAPVSLTDGHLSPAVTATSPRPSPPGAEREESHAPQSALREDDLRVAAYRRRVLEAFEALKDREDGQPIISNKKAARKVGVPYLTIYRWQKAFRAQGFEGLLPRHTQSGRRPANRFSAAEAAQVKALVLQTNRTRTAGSTPEALRVGLKRGIFSPENAELIRSRFAAGQVALPPTMSAQVRVSETATVTYRSPRNAWLNYVQSPGSLMLTIDEVTGLEREIEPGEKWTMDDGTINFVCCVPFNLPGNKCSENFGVMVGRFQFIVPVDHRSHFIPGFNYTARPRSSYRAEDLTATLHTVFREHGYPKAMVLEHGVSAAKLLSDTLNMLGIRIERASSPHQKVIEGIFSKLWTKLSLMPGQVGRFRGEEEEINGLINSCRNGATDPRAHFPMLADVLKALHEAIAEHNSQLIQSKQYGRWVPADLFGRLAAKHLRPLAHEQSWLFSPTISAPLLVRGFKVRTSVCLMEGHSEVFDFSADWMGELNGARVKLYFNQFAPDCVATVVLAENFQGRKAGEVLGVAEQINRMTRFRRRALGYGADPDIGLDATKRNAQALRRSVVAIRTDGAAGAQCHESRSGTGDVQMVSNTPGGDTRPTAAPRGHGFNIPAPTQEEISIRRKKLAESAARARELRSGHLSPSLSPRGGEGDQAGPGPNF